MRNDTLWKAKSQKSHWITQACVGFLGIPSWAIDLLSALLSSKAQCAARWSLPKLGLVSLIKTQPLLWIKLAFTSYHKPPSNHTLEPCSNSTKVVLCWIQVWLVNLLITEVYPTGALVLTTFLFTFWVIWWLLWKEVFQIVLFLIRNTLWNKESFRYVFAYIYVDFLTWWITVKQCKGLLSLVHI